MAVTWGKAKADAAEKAATTDELRAALATLEEEGAEFAKEIAQYKADNAVKDIPNTMEFARVEHEGKIEHARLALSQALKADAGKDPLKGESQATSTRPDLDTASPSDPATKPADNAKTAATLGKADAASAAKRQ